MRKIDVDKNLPDTSDLVSTTVLIQKLVKLIKTPPNTSSLMTTTIFLR